MFANALRAAAFSSSSCIAFFESTGPVEAAALDEEELTGTEGVGTTIRNGAEKLDALYVDVSDGVKEANEVVEDALDVKEANDAAEDGLDIIGCVGGL